MVDIKTAIKQLTHFDSSGRFVYNTGDLKKLFPGDSDRALSAGINRLVKEGILVRASKGVYVYGLSRNKHKHPLEWVARTMRRGEHTYVSLESALSEYGVISQIPIDRVTVMTTGRSGEYKTPFGVVEFTHTKRSPVDIAKSILKVDRPLPIANRKAALRDLKRVGRNLHLVGNIDD